MRPEPLLALMLALGLAGCAAPPEVPAPGGTLPSHDAIFRAGVRVEVDDPAPLSPPEEGGAIASHEFVAGECRPLRVEATLEPGHPSVTATFTFQAASQDGGTGGIQATFDPAWVRLEPGGRANATMTVCAEAGRAGERGHASVGARVEPEVGSVSQGILTRIVAP